MRYLILIGMVFSLLLSSCATSDRNVVRPIWTGVGRPTTGIKTPKGFLISPMEAYGIAWNSGRLSRGNAWHIYADNNLYYVLDVFNGSSPARAVQAGVRVDGRSGGIAR